MSRLLYIFLDTLCGLIVLLPLLVILQKKYFSDMSRRSKVLTALFACFLTAAFVATGIPSLRSLLLGYGMDFGINIIPLTDSFHNIKQFVLNVLLFFPLGLLLPLIWSRFKNFGVTALYGFLLSLFIECSQLFTLRSSDIDDLIANTLGAVLGYFIAKIFVLKTLPDDFPRGGWFPKEPYIITLITFGVMFLIQPFISSFLWELFI